MSMPSDLVPLPTAPYNERPSELPLVVDECRTAIWESGGNISKAARILKVRSSRLRDFIKGSAFLQSEVQEAKEILVDIAEENVMDALIDNDAGRRDSMTKFVLQTQGKPRGWGNGSGSGVNVNPGGGRGRVVISWEDGESFDEPRVINTQAAE